MEQAEQAFKNAQLEVQTRGSLAEVRARRPRNRARHRSGFPPALERTKIRSPIDGVILGRDVEVGQTIQSSQSIKSLFMVAADLSQIEIEAAVVESDIGGIDNGDPVVFTVDAFAGERFQGSVVQVRQLGAESANVVTYTVVVNARNPNGKLLPGMTANVEITADRVADVLRIDYDATRFQPPKDIADAMRAADEANGQGGQQGPGGQGPWPGGQGGPMAGGGRGGGRGRAARRRQQFGEILKTAGVEQERARQDHGRDARRDAEGHGVDRPAASSAAGAGRRHRSAAAASARLPASSSNSRAPERLRQDAADAGGRVPPQPQRSRNTTPSPRHARKCSRRSASPSTSSTHKGELERAQLSIGLSDGENAQIIRGAKEGDEFVVRATAAAKAEILIAVASIMTSTSPSSPAATCRRSTGWATRKCAPSTASISTSHEGEFVAIMGPSGSGKSSLMNLIGALDRPTSGEMWINGRALSEMSRDELADLRNETLGFVFQQFNLLARQDAFQNVRLPLRYARKDVGDIDARAKECLELVGLGTRMDHRPMQLSGGQQQRVAIARALVQPPAHPAGGRTDRRARYENHGRDHAPDAGPQPPGHHRRGDHARERSRRIRQAARYISATAGLNPTARIPNSSARAEAEHEIRRRHLLCCGSAVLQSAAQPADHAGHHHRRRLRDGHDVDR